MTLEQLIAARQAAVDAAQRLHDAAAAEGRELTAEEAAAADKHLDEAERLTAEIETARAQQSRQQRLQAAAAWGDQPQPRAAQTRVGPVRNLEAERPFAHFGEFLGAVRNFYVSSGANRDPRLVADLGDRNDRAGGLGLNVATPSEGGFMVQEDQLGELLSHAYENGEILSRVRRVGLSANSNAIKAKYINETSRADGYRLGGVRSYWVEEGDTLTASKPAFGELSMSLKKLACLGYATEEMLEDYAAMQGILQQGFADEITYAVEEAILWGTGAGQPMGVMTAGCKVAAAKVSGQTAATLWGQNLVDMWTRLWARSRPNAVWLYNQELEPFLLKAVIVGSYGSGATEIEPMPLFLPAGMGLNQSNYNTIFGRPAMPSEHCAAPGTEGDIILGDYSQYLMIDKGAPKPASSIHVRFLQDEQTFRLTYRCNGQPTWPSAVTPAKGTNTLSPFVTCAVRS